MKFTRHACAFLGLVALAVAASPTHAQFDVAVDTTAFPEDAFFYRDLPFGSDRVTGPLDVVFNKGFAFGLASNRDGHVFDYDMGWDHVRHSTSDPFGQIRRAGGWGEFIKTQLFPLNVFEWIGNGFDWEEAGDLGWYPNYMGHLVEGGITHRRLLEWYRSRGVNRAHATILAGVTTMAASIINEAYTHPEVIQQDGSAATVADLYFFDPLGIILFSFDGPARFFAEDLGATVWPGQAAFTPDGELLNTWNHLVLKLDVLPGDALDLFVRTGVGGYLGVTWNRPDGVDISLGAGVDADEQKLSERTGLETVRTTAGAGVFIDRYGSLLASLMIGASRERAAAINIYPGIAHPDLGMFMQVGHDGRMSFGISTGYTLGIGLGFGGG